MTSYYNVWLTMKDSDTVDEFYKYPGEDLPKVGDVIKSRPLPARPPDSCSRDQR